VGGGGVPSIFRKPASKLKPCDSIAFGRAGMVTSLVALLKSQYSEAKSHLDFELKTKLSNTARPLLRQSWPTESFYIL
jgi:hypothetical protein